MTNETNVKQSIKDMDFNMAVDLLADENVRKAVKKSNTVEVNGFKILYSTPNEIFIIKDNNVIARINESSKTFYRSTLAPLAGREVYLEDNLLIYNNHNNTFIDKVKPLYPFLLKNICNKQRCLTANSFEHDL